MTTNKGSMTVDMRTVGEVMGSRAAFYRLMARLFLKPLEADDIEALTAMNFVAQAAALSDDEDAADSEGEKASAKKGAASNSLLVRGLNDMGRGLRRQHTGTRTLLATDYTMCFDGIRQHDGKTASPYASVFLSKDGLLYQEPRNSVFLLFLQSGLNLKPGIDLPEDHISFELEYLAILAERAQAALEDGRADDAAQIIEQSQAFLENHVSTWLPDFTALAGEILETRFYQGVVKAAAGYAELDVDTLADSLEICREAA
ncbi:MAG: molecular chaperone TorD family protein [Eggerthellaceae bacterium]|nr:molecular chaperone TorD family protein [Eggerthellaceae bacterium]